VEQALRPAVKLLNKSRLQPLKHSLITPRQTSLPH